MNETIKWIGPCDQKSPFQRWWDSRTFIQRRLIRFCMSMLVMVVCFPLYYLGLFGNVDGPLHPAHLGERLAGLGVTQTHSMVIFITLVIVSVSWNWIYNVVSRAVGSRLTCRRPNAAGSPCGAAVKRVKLPDRKSGRSVTRFACERGHKRPDADFHPVKKGTVSHCLWVISLVFCGIALVSGY